MTSKTAKIGIAVLSILTLSAGGLALYYAVNKTFPYRDALGSNQHRALNLGAMKSNDEYRKLINTPEIAMRRRGLEKAYRVAYQLRLLRRGDISRAEAEEFLKAMAGPDAKSTGTSSIVDQEQYGKAMVQLTHNLLLFSDSLQPDLAEDFELKGLILKRLAAICDTLDAPLTFTAIQYHAQSTQKIANNLRMFQRNHRATAGQKKQLVFACFPLIARSQDFATVTKFEYFRFQIRIDLIRGKAVDDQLKKLVGDRLTPTTKQSVQMRLPGVADAWESRFNEEFGTCIYDFGQSRVAARAQGTSVLWDFFGRLEKDQTNTEFVLMLFGGKTHLIDMLNSFDEARSELKRISASREFRKTNLGTIE